MIRNYILLVSMMTAVYCSAQCPVADNILSIKHADGTYTTYPVYPYPFLEWNATDYGTIYLHPGDSIAIDMRNWSCGANWIFLVHNDIWIQDSLVSTTTPLGQIITVADVGDYRADNCHGFYCNSTTFTIAEATNTIVALPVHVSAILGGAIDPSAPFLRMRTDLNTNGLLPTTEPYTALGYNFVGGGGETVNLTNNSAIVDWVVVELRDRNDPSQIIASKAALLNSDGGIIEPATLMSPIYFNVVPDRYLIVVRHRNHLGLAKVDPACLCSAPTVPYLNSLTTGAVYGEAGTYTSPSSSISYQTLWPGNVVWDSPVQKVKYTGTNNDRDAILTAVGGATPTATVTGYRMEDVNLDGVVRYTGVDNDRDIILQTIGGVVPTATREEQMPE